MEELREMREIFKELLSLVREDASAHRQSIEFDLARVEAELLAGEALLEEGDDLSVRVLLPRLSRLLRQVSVAIGMDGFPHIRGILDSLAEVEQRIIAKGRPNSTPILEGLGL